MSRIYVSVVETAGLAFLTLEIGGFQYRDFIAVPKQAPSLKSMFMIPGFYAADQYLMRGTEKG